MQICGEYGMPAFNIQDPTFVSTVAGLLEPGVKYTRPPDDCIVLELLVQDNPDTPCVTVRPLQL
jgi:hypothetical protein